MLLNLLEGNEIHKVIKKVEYHIKLKLRVFATCNDISRLPAAFVWRFQRLTLKEYTKEQFIQVAIGLARQYLLMNDQYKRKLLQKK
jgi:hypothetical protein